MTKKTHSARHSPTALPQLPWGSWRSGGLFGCSAADSHKIRCKETCFVAARGSGLGTMVHHAPVLQCHWLGEAVRFEEMLFGQHPKQCVICRDRFVRPRPMRKDGVEA